MDMGVCGQYCSRSVGLKSRVPIVEDNSELSQRNAFADLGVGIAVTGKRELVSWFTHCGASA